MPRSLPPSSFLTLGVLRRAGQLWVDDQLIVDQWSSLSTTTPTAELPLTAAFTPRDFRAIFSRPAVAVNSTTPATLMDNGGGATYDLLASNRLWLPLDLSGSPFPVILN